ncbi:carbohydrate-binding protein [Paenibacillus tepidiphilus]|uniref:carbohydrate-binding protein n=1 Tax=Paenibacillus tepidiphilus TaxID=2608683 RepID=UPI0013A5A918|nr:carbohydrate-binding protein [Paenibacillus tepidiphilus]
MDQRRLEYYTSPVDGTTGAPLGGFGAGAVKFCAHQGTFSCVTQPPADQNDYTAMGATKLQLFTERQGRIQAVETLKARFADGRYEDDAIWPVHSVHFDNVNDIEVRLTAFAPFVPFGSDELSLMSMPYAFYELTLQNLAETAVTAACAFQLDIASGSAACIPGSGLTSDRWSVIARSGDPEAVITSGGGDDFFRSGLCEEPAAGTVNKAAVKITLQGHATQTIRFVLAWYDNTDPERAYCLGCYPDSASIARLGMTHFDSLKENARKLVAGMRGSNLPAWLINQTLNTLANLSNNSMYKRDGRVAFAEGEWTCFGTMDQMWHARQIINQLIPDFAWRELRYWARTQKSNGQIHHDFNSGDKDKSALVGWDDREHADYRNIDKWVDLNAGFIISVYETFVATGDIREMAYFWPYLRKAGHRILEQAERYGSAEHPFTFEDSENSYDAGGDPNPYNASLSAVAYKIMILLAPDREEAETAAVFQAAYDSVVASFRARYLQGEFPAGRGCEAYFAGQWISLFLKLGQIWTAEETDVVLDSLDRYYHPYYWGLGHLGGTYKEWTPYLLTHYGGLLLNTGREAQWEALQKDAYNRQYLDRNHVFNHPLDILPAVDQPVYPATQISGDKQYISMPGLWRNYYNLVGWHRNRATGEIWIEPILLEEMEHRMNRAMFATPEGYGTISCTEYGSAWQNRRITVTCEHEMTVSAIYLTDHYGAQVAVTVNGEPVKCRRTGEGYGSKLRVEWSGTIGGGGITVVAEGDAGYMKPALPAKPAAGADSAGTRVQLNAYDYMEAEGASEAAGVTMVTPVGRTWFVTDCHNFDYIKFDNVEFGEVGSRLFLAKVSSAQEDSRIEIVLDSVGGDIIGVCPVPYTGGGQAWVLTSCPIRRTTGTHHVILKFYGHTEDNLLNIDKFKFLQDDGRLDRTGWKVRASKGNLNAHHVLMPDRTTSWGVAQQMNGDYLLIDMHAVQSFDSITLYHKEQEVPAHYAVFVSDDGVNFGASIAEGCGNVASPDTVINFQPQRARAVKVVLTEAECTRAWTVYEVLVRDSRLITHN